MTAVSAFSPPDSSELLKLGLPGGVAKKMDPARLPEFQQLAKDNLEFALFTLQALVARLEAASRAFGAGFLISLFADAGFRHAEVVGRSP